MVLSHLAHHKAIVSTPQRLAQATQKKRIATRENLTIKTVTVLFHLTRCTMKTSTHQERIETIRGKTTVPSDRIPSTTVIELSHLTLQIAYARQARLHMTQTKIQDMKVTTKAHTT